MLGLMRHSLLRAPQHTALPAIRCASRRAVLDFPPSSLPIRRFSRSSQSGAQYVRFGGAGGQGPAGKGGFSWRKQLGVGVGLAGGAYYVSHLEQVPDTGRWRFMDASPKYETHLAEEARKELLESFRGRILPPNHPVHRYVQQVVERLLDANNLGHLREESHPQSVASFKSPFAMNDDVWDPDRVGESGADEDKYLAPGTGGREWTLLVVNDAKTVNAMATYGSIVVFTGILPICQDEEGVAAVLGHEIAHVVARHMSESYSNVKILLALSTLLSWATGVDFGISQLATQLLLELPNSRTKELEADKIGLKLMARACYNPKASPEMFTRLAAANQGPGIEFLQTHPIGKRRVQELMQQLPDAYQAQAESPACSGVQSSFDAFRAVLGNKNGSRW